MSQISILTSPACLIYTTMEGKLQVCKRVMEQVKQLDGPLVVVAIAGLYRTGKSYLLNRLADLPSSNGFALGSTIESKTKGIWVFVRPHPVLKDHYLVLLDTEGLGDAEKGDSNHDNWIFCLATLLSSTLCFNAKSVIDEDSIKKLNFITELSQHFRVKSGDDSANHFDYSFPNFVYILRDFFLNLEKDGKKISLDEYLEDSLKLRPETTDGDKSYNLPRKCMHKYFKRRHCFAFHFPTSQENMMSLDTLPESELSAEFLKDAALFCHYIYNNAPAKKLDNGQALHGRMWASLVTAYIDAISTGTILCVENAVTAMATMENTRVIKHCLTLYNEKMDSGISFPTATSKILADHHFATLKLVLAEFMRKSVFDQENKFHQKLNNQVAMLYEEFIVKNDCSSEKKCRLALNIYEAPYSKKLSSGVYTCKGGYALYQAHMSNVKKAYELCQDLGVKKNDVFLEFLKAKWIQDQSVLEMDKKITNEEKKTEEAHMRAKEAKMQQKAADQARKEAEEKGAEKERELQAKLTSETKKMREEYKKVFEERLAEQERLMKEGFSQEAALIQEKINELNRQKKNREEEGCVIQ